MEDSAVIHGIGRGWEHDGQAVLLLLRESSSEPRFFPMDLMFVVDLVMIAPWGARTMLLAPVLAALVALSLVDDNVIGVAAAEMAEAVNIFTGLAESNHILGHLDVMDGDDGDRYHGRVLKFCG